MKKQQKIKLFFLFFALLLLEANFVSALEINKFDLPASAVKINKFDSAAFALEINYPKVPGAEAPQDFVNSASPEQVPSLYIKYFLNLLFWISGIIILGAFVWASILYLSSAGKMERMVNAREQISAALLGILLLLSSFIVLRILNPQLLILKLPEIKMATTTERTEVPAIATTTEMTRTAIDTELPLGKILDDYLFASSTMAAVKNNATTTLDIANTLRNNAYSLNGAVQGCSCSQAKPICTCPDICSQDCDCDVCKSQRGAIGIYEAQNLQKIDELKIQQNKSIELLKKIRADLGKLERVERFMKECPMWRIGSLPQFFYDKDFYIAQKWTLRNVRFWENIIIGEDWVTLFCPVSGTILGETPGIPASSIESELPSVEAPSAEQQMACSTKIPIGEIIDRAKRIADRLRNRLESLIDLDRKIIQAVDKMHVLVSMCTSKKPMCCSVCIDCGEWCCDKSCTGQACPFYAIARQASIVGGIQREIETVVTESSEQNIGIVPIVDKIVPKLLEDLDKLVRRPTKECITDIPTENAVESTEVQVMLSDCESAVRTVGPEGVVIQKCCLTEQGFQNCLQNCYLKSDADYEKCLNDCLKNTNDNEISICNHSINFYCCGL